MFGFLFESGGGAGRIFVSVCFDVCFIYSALNGNRARFTHAHALGHKETTAAIVKGWLCPLSGDGVCLLAWCCFASSPSATYKITATAHIVIACRPSCFSTGVGAPLNLKDDEAFPSL